MTKQAVMELPQIEPEQVKEFADSVVSGEVKEQKRAEAQEIAELVTLSEVQLGRMLKEIPKAQGQRSDLETSLPSGQEVKPKAETVKELGFTSKQVSQFQRMADHEEVNSTEVEVTKPKIKTAVVEAVDFTSNTTKRKILPRWKNPNRKRKLIMYASAYSYGSEKATADNARKTNEC